MLTSAEKVSKVSDWTAVESTVFVYHRVEVKRARCSTSAPRLIPHRGFPEVLRLDAAKLQSGNLQHRLSCKHTTLDVRLLSTLGYLVGAKIERYCLETENSQLSNWLGMRLARAKRILQRDLSISEDEPINFRPSSPRCFIIEGNRAGVVQWQNVSFPS